MTWLWTWGGRSFGYRHEDNLFTSSGNNIGYFKGEEVYACSNGRYLGELKNGKLITKQSSQHKHASPKVSVIGASHADKVDHVGYVMYAGYEDFPEFK